MQIWVDVADTPKSPPIGWLRQEARQTNTPNSVIAYIDPN